MATTKSSTDRCCPNQLTPSKILKKEIHKIHISSPPPPAKRSLASSTRITTNMIHRKDDPSSSSLSPYVVNNNGEEDAASSDGGWFYFKTTVNSLEYSATSFCTPSYSNPVCVLTYSVYSIRICAGMNLQSMLMVFVTVGTKHNNKS